MDDADGLEVAVRLPVYIQVAIGDAPLRRHAERGEDAQERGLSRSVWPDEARRRPGLERVRQAAEDERAERVSLHNVLYPERALALGRDAKDHGGRR